MEKPAYEDRFSDNELETEDSKNIIPKEINSPISKKENNTQLSTQESDLSQENSGINKLILVTKKTSEVTKELFESVIQALKNLKSKSTIKDYRFIDNKFESQIDFVLTTFNDTLSSHKEECSEIDSNDSWLKLNERREGKKAFLGYREYLLVEININENIFYLLEIGKKSTEGYSGLVFRSNDLQKFNDSKLLSILKKIILKKGNYIKKENNSFKPISLDIDYSTYKHYFNKKSKSIQI